MKLLCTNIILPAVFFLASTGFKVNAQCTIPTGLIAGDVAGTTVLSWDDVPDADNYQIEIEDATGNPETFEIEFDVFDNTYSPVGLGLTEGFSYKFKVRSECGGDQSDYSPFFTFTAGIGGVTTTLHNINVEDNEFNPSSLNVNVGDTIRWSWDNSAGAHTTTSTAVPPGAVTWDQPIDASNQNFDYKVTVAGIYNYKCTFHEAMGMVGSFTATGATAVNSFTSGSFTLYNNIITGAIHITINLNTPEHIQVRLYDMNGIVIKELSNATHAAGVYSEMYAVNDLATGMYLLQLQTSTDMVVKKIVIE